MNKRLPKFYNDKLDQLAWECYKSGIEAEKREDQLDINKMFDVGDIDEPEPESVPWKTNVLKIEWIWVDPGRIRDESAADPRTLTIQG